MARIYADRVKQTSTTTGTGPFAVSGTPSGYRAFSVKCAVGDTFEGSIVNDNGEWQSGIFSYSGANQISTVTVYESSNADAAVTFSAGTKDIFIGLTARRSAGVREKLTAARTYYVRTDGNDANTGLANTSGGAFLTIQKAVNVVVNEIDAAGYGVTIQLGDGTYTAGATLGKVFGAENVSVVIQGNAVTPSNVVISTTSAAGITANFAGDWHVKDLKLQTTTSGYGLVSNYGSLLRYSNIVFGACASGHMSASNTGALRAEGNYSIVGAAPSHWYLSQDGRLTCASRTITITGTPAFSSAFAVLTLHANCVITGNTYTGSATGKRYDVSRLAYCNSGVTLPGDVAGTTATGGLYE